MDIKDMTLSNADEWRSLMRWRYRRIKNKNTASCTYDMPSLWREKLPVAHADLAGKIRRSYARKDRTGNDE